MNNKDHITNPVVIFDKINSTHEEKSNDKIEEIPKICKLINNFILITGKIISCVIILLIATIVIQVLLRYLFSINIIQLEELQWHLYAIVFMFGLSFTMVNHSHVRVDILKVRLNASTQRKIEIFGIIFLMIPFIFITIDYGYQLAYDSFRVNEGSISPEGLPYRWIIKSVIPISFILLLLASISRLIRHSVYLYKGRKNGN